METEDKLMIELQACREGDVCRTLMDDSACLVFNDWSRLKAKIRQFSPEKLLTDCLSCWIQFNQITPYAVYHPIEIIEASYDTYGKNSAKEVASKQ